MPLNHYPPYKNRIHYEQMVHKVSRERYIEIVKNMGLSDICECSNITTRRRQDSGLNGELECTECHYLKYPLQYMYPCDECTEPTLSPYCYLSKSIEFLCDDCLYG